MTTQQSNSNSLPQGFKNLTPQVQSKFYTNRPSDGSKAHKASLDAVLNSVVQFSDGYLTCFGDNSPIVGNTIAAATDAVLLNTKSLTRGEVKKLLPMVTHVQRHAYYPGFPRFLSVGGAITFNTWKPAQRLIITDADCLRWMKLQHDGILAANKTESDQQSSKASAFISASEPMVWSILMKMLFGNEYSHNSSEAFQNEREVFTRWAASVVHKPLQRALWAPVLRSVHGIGKGTFESVMRSLMGSAAVNSVANIEGLTGTHSGDAALTRLLVLNEVLQKGKDTKADQRLKMFISDPVIEINRKHEQRFFTLATHSTILYSNSRTPFTVPKTERRFWVPEYRLYDVGEEHGQAFHAEGNKHIRKFLTDPNEVRRLLCWLKVVADSTPHEFLAVAPPSVGIKDMFDMASEDLHCDLMAWLGALGPRSAIQLAQIQEVASIPQADLTHMLKTLGFRNCQMKIQQNKKVWTKSPMGIGPQVLEQYTNF